MKEALSKVPKNRGGAENRPKSSKKAKLAKKPQKRLRSVLKVVALAFLMLVFVGATTIASQLLVGYVMLWIIGPVGLSKTVPTAIYSALSYILATVIIVYVTREIRIRFLLKDEKQKTRLRAKGKLRDELGLSGLPTWVDIGLSLIGFVVSLLMAYGLVWIFNQLPWFNADEVQSVGFSVYTTGIERVIAFIVLVVIAPIFEEIIFRGWLYGKLRGLFHEKMPEIAGIIIANLLVSILFGVIHLQWNVGVNVFALSIVLCAFREITGTIHAGILTHMIKNGVAFYLLYVMGM